MMAGISSDKASSSILWASDSDSNSDTGFTGTSVPSYYIHRALDTVSMIIFHRRRNHGGSGAGARYVF